MHVLLFLIRLNEFCTSIGRSFSGAIVCVSRTNGTDSSRVIVKSCRSDA